jgi:hypothetical protein
LNSHAQRTTVSSSITSQSPRVSRNRETFERVRPREAYRKADVPARKINAGAAVGDPADEEERDRGLGKIGGLKPDVGEVVAHVVECHDHHDDAMPQVDRLEPARAGLDNGEADTTSPA